MRHLIEKNSANLVVITSILLLVIGTNEVRGQHDTATGKQFLKDTVATGQLFRQHISFPVLYISRIPHSFTHYPLLTSYPFRTVNENKVSKTILTVLGIGAFAIFGDRANHSYQPYNSHL